MFILNKGNKISRKDKIELGRVFISPNTSFRPRNLLDYQSFYKRK